MRASIIKIGNSQGLCLPEPIIKQCGFENEVELEVRNNEVIIRPVKKVRYNWDQAFKTMAEKEDDKLIEFPDSEWDEKEWEWM
jgi:antitoxin MazE